MRRKIVAYKSVPAVEEDARLHKNVAVYPILSHMQVSLTVPIFDVSRAHLNYGVEVGEWESVSFRGSNSQGELHARSLVEG